MWATPGEKEGSICPLSLGTLPVLKAFSYRSPSPTTHTKAGSLCIPAIPLGPGRPRGKTEPSNNPGDPGEASHVQNGDDNVPLCLQNSVKYSSWVFSQSRSQPGPVCSLCQLSRWPRGALSLLRGPHPSQLKKIKSPAQPENFAAFQKLVRHSHLILLQSPTLNDNFSNCPALFVFLFIVHKDWYVVENWKMS